MPDSQTLELLETAALIVQLTIERVDVPEAFTGDLGDCLVTGRVGRVFRGNLAEGAPLSFVVPTYRGDVPLGDGYQDLTRLRSAHFIEAYLQPDGGARPWRTLDTLLLEQLGDAPAYLTALRSNEAGFEDRKRRWSVRSLVQRLLGRR